ncbi:TPA: hypothetical protein ACPJUG_000533 [Haemophilus influenzae]|uniref:hypothetical protein n=1 Tax=Haemophilus influenzae TaxID=727 RepID=UPI000D415BFB|nr:hypothetical protein [Haemophilus influenzae]PRJ52380.1 hypothetical protein BV094_01002 [Haemophilus influenzae]PRJ58290.1 hypothetical protein BV097_00399 [Haemophilus influenzae]PRM07074.1 hypothetical protein BV006_01649 [Haemophilus influenzae]PRM15435.1 hypothetical protein BV011_00753 [Haemophilus influenzae]
MNKVTYQIKAYDSNKKPWILGGTENLETVLEIVRCALENRKEYHALTIQRLQGVGNE